MKKKLSVIISVICIIVSLGSISGTLYYAKNHNTSSMMQQAGGTPPSMPNQGENSSQENSKNNESNQQDSSQNNQSSNDQSNSQNQDSNDQTNESSNGQAPNNQQDSPGQNQQNNNQPDQMNQEMTSSSQSLTALQIVIISISVLVFMLAITYLIMSKFGSKTLVETFYGSKPTAIYAVINVVGTILLVCALVLSSNALLSSI